ncbi:hypothetical protein OS493_025970 [Desmophyllum pertusum]|uniref:Plastocyanin-like domain-containing protein n=1 Tax=Desmophyllum pertusum TaxID=174260 RepID=A0A9W9YMF8_9CNID|nr:hypothetical protein OS493_025970 [Desmophyllum pertusum]
MRSIPTVASRLKKTNLAHLGFLGPVIRAEVGDVIEVVFMNNASLNYSVQPHGVFFNKSNEGSGTKIAHPGLKRLTILCDQARLTLIGGLCPRKWVLPRLTRNASRGYTPPAWIPSRTLMQKGSLNDDNTQKNIDKEYVLLFTVTDENESWYQEKNKNRANKPNEVDEADEDYQESNKMHGINGYMYANLPGLDMCLGDKVSWHMIGLGNEVDIHTAYFYGNTFVYNGNIKDTVSLLPGDI